MGPETLLKSVYNNQRIPVEVNQGSGDKILELDIDLINNTGRDIVEDCGYGLLMFTADRSFDRSLLEIDDMTVTLIDDSDRQQSEHALIELVYRYTDGVKSKDYSITLDYTFNACMDQNTLEINNDS